MRHHKGKRSLVLNVHLLYLQTGQIHTADNIWKQSNHIIIAHGHVGDDLLESDLLGGVILVLFASANKLLSQLCYFSLE